MRVSDIIRDKGKRVATVRTDDSISAAVAVLGTDRVGAVVVTDDGQQIAGILSERDIVRSLAENEAQSVMDGPVSGIMTSDVITCAKSDGVESLMALMTERRIRHLPVTEDGHLSGIVSIGDIVKCRLAELEQETKLMEEYIHQGR